MFSGGPGGCALASRLTEIPDFSVLLVEAGGLYVHLASELSLFLANGYNRNDNIVPMQVPLLASQLSPNTQWDWNFTITTQVYLDNRTFAYPRGFGLGGSSAISALHIPYPIVGDSQGTCTDGLAYTRGSKDDYDHWAALIGNDSWSWDALLPYFLKVSICIPFMVLTEAVIQSERWNAPQDGHDTTDQYNPQFHSSSGFIGASLPGFPREMDPLVINTTKELEEFPFNLDGNSGQILGLGELPVYLFALHDSH